MLCDEKNYVNKLVACVYVPIGINDLPADINVAIAKLMAIYNVHLILFVQLGNLHNKFTIFLFLKHKCYLQH